MRNKIPKKLCRGPKPNYHSALVTGHFQSKHNTNKEWNEPLGTNEPLLSLFQAFQQFRATTEEIRELNRLSLLYLLHFLDLHWSLSVQILMISDFLPISSNFGPNDFSDQNEYSCLQWSVKRSCTFRSKRSTSEFKKEIKERSTKRPRFTCYFETSWAEMKWTKKKAKVWESQKNHSWELEFSVSKKRRRFPYLKLKFPLLSDPSHRDTLCSLPTGWERHQ